MDMESHCFLCFHSACFLLLASAACCLSHPSFLSVHPLDEKYYSSEVIKCKDGSKSFSRDRLNDNFCDGPDGTDEPDCCDGSDEYGGTIRCPNTCHGWECVMGGNAEYMNKNYNSKLAIILQVILVIFLVFIWSFSCCTRSGRRRYH